MRDPARLPRLLHGRERLAAPPVPPDTAWAGLCPPGLISHFPEGKTSPGTAGAAPGAAGPARVPSVDCLVNSFLGELMGEPSAQREVGFDGPGGLFQR